MRSLHTAAADPAPATAPGSGPFHWPHCGTTHSAYGRKFRDARHLLQHSSRCAYRAPAPVEADFMQLREIYIQSTARK